MTVKLTALSCYFSLFKTPVLKLRKITDTTYLIIINDTYTLKNKSYEKGQCVKMINNYMVHTSTQDEVDDILTTTKINRIIIDKGVSTRKDLALKRNKNGEIRNKKVIILPDKDDDEEILIISFDCFLSIYVILKILDLKILDYSVMKIN
jgi:hypothetical protein